MGIDDLGNKLTVNRISILIAVIITLVSLLFFSTGEQWPIESRNGNTKVVKSFLFLGVVFLIVKYFLGLLIFSRLRQVYKIISDSSTIKNDRINYKMGGDKNLSIINKNVLEWTTKKKHEVESLKELEKYRKNYIGNISHELKTPLFSMQGYLHTLLDGGLEDQAVNRRYIVKALDNAERLQYIIDDLDTINKLELSSSLDREEFNIKRLFENVIGDLEMVSVKKNIRLSINKTSKRGLWVEADRSKIRQVVENLLTNSIKYGVNNGLTRINFIDLENFLKIEISDNGIGIAPKHINHLFDRFYRVDKSRSRNRGGSGLGLSIVKHIIEAHGQKIEVISKEGKGSTFTFNLPKMKYNLEQKSQ
ncbi:MAG: ATP-binding protein [Saprospiraceae bacterium]